MISFSSCSLRMFSIWFAAIGVAFSTAVFAQEIPAGTPIVIRTVEAIDSHDADLAREYTAGLDEPLVINEVTVAPRGTKAFLRVAETQESGKLRGRASLTLKLAKLIVGDRLISIESGEVKSESDSQGAKTARRGIMGGIVGGAVGGILGGGKGAAAGAGVGAAAGVGSAALSGQRVRVAGETRLTFTLATPVTIPQ